MTDLKENYKRQRAAQSIAKKRLAILSKIDQFEQKMKDLQESCSHYNSWYENCGSSGNWDRDDHYWRHYECLDCGKVWNTDQSYQQDKNYPYAVKGKRSSNGVWKGVDW